MKTKRHEFDWVKARADCDEYKLFSDLREAVRDDCQSAKDRTEKRNVLTGIVFEHNPGKTVFSVSRRKDSRIFKLEESCITVIDRKGDEVAQGKSNSD